MKNMKIVVLVLIVICALGNGWADVSENAPAASVDEARSLLRRSFDLWIDRHLDEAEVLIKRVIAFDPKFRAEYPDERINLQAMAALGDVYYDQGKWQDALETYERAEEILREYLPNADSILPIRMAKCREKLAELGALNKEDAMITVGGKLLAGGGLVRNGVTLVDVTELAELLNLEPKDENKTMLLRSREGERRSLVLTVGVASATSGRLDVPLAAAPVRDGEGILAPLRQIAEFFGAKVKWEAIPRIARVF